MLSCGDHPTVSVAMSLPSLRLRHHLLSAPITTGPVDVVRRFGAMQAQEFSHAKWAVGLRCPSATDDALERCIRERTIIRTSLLRGTLHLVAASDIRWMLAVAAPIVNARYASLHRKLGLDDDRFGPIMDTIRRHLEGGRHMTRPEVLAPLERLGITTNGQHGNHILYRAALGGLICMATPRGKQTTYTLLDEWCPGAPTFDRDAALTELAFRYFDMHGPATLADFIFWSGMQTGSARAVLDMAAPRLHRERWDGQEYWMSPDTRTGSTTEARIHLLAGFDEYVLGYKDRGAVLAPEHVNEVITVNGIFKPVILIDGRVVGTWARTFEKSFVRIDLTPFRALRKAERQGIGEAAERYGAYLNLRVCITYANEAA